MATTNNIPFGLGQGVSGIPMNQSMQSSLSTGQQGGSGTTSFIQGQNVSNNFYSWLGTTTGNEAWTETTDANGNPTYFAAQRGGDNNVQYISTSVTLDQNVLNGNNTPSQFTWNGQTYNIVGTLTTTVAYNQTPLWYVQVPLGVAELYPIMKLGGVIWSNVLKPILQGAVNGLKTCFTKGNNVEDGDDVDSGAEDAAEDAGVEGAEVGGDTTVDLVAAGGAMVGLVALAAIPILISVFAHSSYHSLQLYNLTPYNLTWNLAYQAHGAINLAPTTGQGSKNYQYLIPAMSSWAPPGDTPVNSANNATFGFASSSQLTGIGYVLGFTLTDPTSGDTIDSGAVMFDVPWAGDNSLAAAVGSIGSASDWYSAQAGQATNQVTQAVASDANVKVTATFDYLSGQHPGPSGQDMYWYNSLLVFEPGSSTNSTGKRES